MKQPKLGSGQRFKKLKAALAKRGDVKNPGAVEVSVGQQKFGGSGFPQLSVPGKIRNT